MQWQLSGLHAPRSWRCQTTCSDSPHCNGSQSASGFQTLPWKPKVLSTYLIVATPGSTFSRWHRNGPVNPGTPQMRSSGSAYVKNNLKMGTLTIVTDESDIMTLFKFGPVRSYCIFRIQEYISESRNVLIGSRRFLAHFSRWWRVSICQEPGRPDIGPTSFSHPLKIRYNVMSDFNHLQLQLLLNGLYISLLRKPDD